jgi:hypothetical protein
MIPRAREKPKSESEFLIDDPEKSNHSVMMGEYHIHSSATMNAAAPGGASCAADQ